MAEEEMLHQQEQIFSSDCSHSSFRSSSSSSHATKFLPSLISVPEATYTELTMQYNQPSEVRSSVNNYIPFAIDDYQYLKKSRIPTLHFQPSLPRLPIPLLEKSCERYLRAQQPLRSPKELSTLQKLVADFQSKDGPILQKELKLRDSINKKSSYISAPWFEMYLKDRKPLPINYNPFLVFINDPKPEYNDQLIRAANLLISSLRFMKSFRANSLKPEVFHLNPQKSDTNLFYSLTQLLPPYVSWYGAYIFKAFPLDMSQYANLFNTCRIPEKNIDRLVHDPSARHIMVMKNGNIFKVNVLDESGYIYGPDKIFASLKWIINEDHNFNPHPIGVLTTLNRDEWADYRKCLEKIGNKEALEAIDSSILNLIFDNEEPTNDYKKLVQRFLHSDGVNRWFDKSFSLIIQKNGIAGLNFEHSWGDGIAVLRYFNDIYKDSSENPQIHPNSSIEIKGSSNLIRKLDFRLDDTAKQFIENAKLYYLNVCSSLDVEIFEFLEFGKMLCRTHNISPDSLMQQAFQMAHYKLNRKFVSTYESCSTAAFRHGRTETIRPCTLELKAMTEALFSENKMNRDTLLQMMKLCSSVHGNLIKEAVMGQGFDRHLFVLEKIAKEGNRIPDLFTHPFHKSFNHYVMSTSTLNSNSVMLGAFGPVVKDGYGIAYTVWNERLGSIVSYYKNEVNGSGYMECLKDALKILHNVLK